MLALSVVSVRLRTATAKATSLGVWLSTTAHLNRQEPGQTDRTTLLRWATVASSSADLIDVALRAAVAGGEILLAEAGETEAEAKGTGDYVSKVDRRSGRRLRGDGGNRRLL